MPIIQIPSDGLVDLSLCPALAALVDSSRDLIPRGPSDSGLQIPGCQTLRNQNQNDTFSFPKKHVVHEQRGRDESGHRDGLWLQQWPERLCGRGNTFMLVES